MREGGLAESSVCLPDGSAGRGGRQGEAGQAAGAAEEEGGLAHVASLLPDCD